EARLHPSQPAPWPLRCRRMPPDGPYAPSLKADDAEIIANMITICDEFETYGYGRVGAELRHRGILVNSKKIRRLMREHDLQPKRRKRFVATTDSDHDGRIFAHLAPDRLVDGPTQRWVADITYIAIGAGFVYSAVSTPGRAGWSDMRLAARSTHVWQLQH